MLKLKDLETLQLRSLRNRDAQRVRDGQNLSVWSAAARLPPFCPGSKAAVALPHSKGL
jgi:hypothetical protein